MKNFVQPGKVVTLTAPYQVLSGGGLLVGSIFGVACDDAANAAQVEAAVAGVFDLAKASGAVSEGDKIYWDNTNKVVTTVAGSNPLIGIAIQAQQSGDATARVLLNPSPDLPTALTATATLDFGSINAGLAADLTITVTGAAVGDAVALGVPAAFEAGLTAFGFVSAANTVTVRVVNNTAGAVDAASGTFRATVFK